MYKILIATALLFTLNLWAYKSLCPQIQSQVVDTYQKAIRGANTTISICDIKGDSSEICIQAQQLFKQLESSILTVSAAYDKNCPNPHGMNAFMIADLVGNYILKKREVQIRDKDDYNWWREVPKNRKQYEILCKKTQQKCPLIR